MVLKTQKKSYIVIIWMLILVALLSAGYFLIIKEIKPETPKYIMVFSEPLIEPILDTEENDSLLGEPPAVNPFNIPDSDSSKIAVIINNMGLNENLTDVISKSVNENISLAFSSYTRNLQNTINSTHELNKETYVRLDTISDDYLNEDTGPKALTLENTEADKKLLFDILNTAQYVDGIIIDGYIDPDKKDGMGSILNSLSENGILLIDATDNDVISNISIENLHKIRADIIVNEDTSVSNFNNFLDTAETIAKEKGQAVIVINPKPINIIMIVEWIEKLSKAENEQPIVFVPVSTLITK